MPQDHSDHEVLDGLLKSRHSCRAFEPRLVPKGVIEQILRTAQRVPSWCNSQPWKVTLCQGKTMAALGSALLEAAQKGMQSPDIDFPQRYSGEYKHRRSVCGWQLYEAVGVTKGDRAASLQQMMENYRFFGAPHVSIITTPKELGAYGAVDCGAYVTAFTLAAQALGIATIPQAAIAGLAPVVRAQLDLPEDRDILCAISFGYADLDHSANKFRTHRAGLDEVVTWCD